MAENSPIAEMYIQATDGGSLRLLAQEVKSFLSRQENQKIKVGVELNPFGDPKMPMLINKLGASVMREMKSVFKLHGINLADAINMDTGKLSNVANVIFKQIAASIPAMGSNVQLNTAIRHVLEKALGDAAISAGIKAENAASAIRKKVAAAEFKGYREEVSGEHAGIKAREDIKRHEARQRLEEYRARSASALKSRAERDVSEPNLYGMAAINAARESRNEARAQGLFDIRKLAPGPERKAERERFYRELERAYAPYLNTLEGMNPQTIDRMSQQAFKSSFGSETGLGNRPEVIREALENAKKEAINIQAHFAERAKKVGPAGPDFEKMNSEARRAAQGVFDLDKKLEQHKRIVDEISKISARDRSGIFGHLDAQKLKSLRTQMDQLIDPTQGKNASAHGLNFAMMNAAYGFQDFFQVLAQPGMGVGRAFLAAANNIGPALGMIAGSAVGANVAIGALLAGMAGLNMVMNSSANKTEKEYDSLRKLTSILKQAAQSARDFRAEIQPFGGNVGASGIENAIKKMLGVGSQGAALGAAANRSAMGNKQAIPGVAGSLFSENMPAIVYRILAETFRSPGRAVSAGESDVLRAAPVEVGQLEENYKGLDSFKIDMFRKERQRIERLREEENKEGGVRDIMAKRLQELRESQASAARLKNAAPGAAGRFVEGARMSADMESRLGPLASGVFRDSIASAIGASRSAVMAKERASAELIDFEANEGESIKKLEAEKASNRKTVENAIARNDLNQLLIAQEMETRNQEIDAELVILRNERKALRDNKEAIDAYVESLKGLPGEISKLPGAARHVREILFSDDRAARQSNVGGYLEKGIYGGRSGRMLNFEERIRAMREELAARLKGNISEAGRSDLLSAHRKAVVREIESVVGGSMSGKSSIMDSASVWQRIQESLTNDPSLQVEERQLDTLQRILDAIRSGRSPVGAAWDKMISPAADGQDAGGYAGQWRRPSSRDKIPAMLRENEVVLTPEHQSRIASMFGMTPKSLFGSMGMAQNSLSGWAGSPIGFDAGGFVNGQFMMPAGGDFPNALEQSMGLFSALGRQAYTEGRSRSPLKTAWKDYRRLFAKTTSFNKGYRAWVEEEPFRERYAEYGRKSARFGMSGFYRNQGPLYQRRQKFSGVPATHEVTNAEAWIGGMPYFGQRGTGSLPVFDFSSIAKTLPEERLRESAAQSPFLSARGSVSMENAAKARESGDYVAKMRKFGKEFGDPNSERRARKEQLSRVSPAAAESMQRMWEKADAARKLSEERATMTPEQRRQQGNESARAKVEAKRTGPAFDNRQAYLDLRAQGFSKEEAKATADRQEREFKNKQAPVSSTTRGTTRTNSWMSKADVSDREDSSGGLSKEKQDRLNELSKDVQPAMDVRGGDRGARWRSGMEDDRRMERDASRGAMEAWKKKFDELPGKLMQNVPGMDQAKLGGASNSAIDRQNNLLEKVVQTLESSSAKSEKAAKSFVDAIENSGLVIV